MSRADITSWIALVEKSKQEIDSRAKDLQRYGATVNLHATRQVDAIAYIAQFLAPDAITKTTIRIVFMDHQTTSDIVLTNITTLPEANQKKGYGSYALQRVLEWARHHQFNEVRATQVRRDTILDTFLTKHGFTKCPEPNPCNDYVLPLK